MVLKIDHVSFSCDNSYDYSQVIKDKTLDFSELNLVNIDCKRAFLREKIEYHNIFMYKGSEDTTPIEITQYPSVDGINNNISLQERKLQWLVGDIAAAEDFFGSIGFKCVEDNPNKKRMEIKPFFDKAGFEIVLLKSDEYVSIERLDVLGYSSVGLVVDNVEKEIKKIQEKGFFCSGVSVITVAGKAMNIGFAKGKNGEIAELISVVR